MGHLLHQSSGYIGTETLYYPLSSSSREIPAPLSQTHLTKIRPCRYSEVSVLRSYPWPNLFSSGRLCKAVGILPRSCFQSEAAMSSLRDIMDDVDTEPLQSQAYRRSKEAAQEQLPPPSDTPSPETTSLSSEKSTGKQPIKRRRSNRVHPIPLPQDSSSDTGVAKGMDYSYSTGQQGGPSQQQGPYRSSEQFSRQSEPALDVPVKYTPITGRVSRAKKGVPVHTCEICRPVKVRPFALSRNVQI